MHVSMDTYNICWGGEIAQFGRARGVILGAGVRILVTAIIVSCAAIRFPAVENLQHRQRPVPLTPCLYGVGG